MPGPPAHSASTSATPTSGTQITEPMPESPAANNQDSPHEIPTTTTALSNPSAPTPDDAGVQPKEVLNKKNQFCPSKAKTVRYVSVLPLSTITFIMIRGLAERQWHRNNPNGTKDDFAQHLKSLSNEKLKVCKITVSGGLANVTSQELEQTATAKVASIHVRFKNIY